MRGIILAGGTGSRLHPLTRVTNKHLLPVYDKPMIYHPLETLKSLGLKDILIVTGGESLGDMMNLLGSGTDQGIRLTYKIQDKARGIADALLCAEDYCRNDGKVAVILGDNIFDPLKFPSEVAKDNDAYIFLKEVQDPERFGVANFNEKNEIIGIEEKPKTPKSNFAVTGLYIYPSDVFEFIKTLQPSKRGELEITDVNNHYLKNKKLKAVKVEGHWSDAGTFPSLLRASLIKAGIANGSLYDEKVIDLIHKLNKTQ
ncbi:NTP transferase domain-containing protein [Candidatus Woesearchaeota archaeon]|nr:NTP transferase domain-containing protein [Candidatus Woesearchaeota archaeon]